MIFRGSRPRPRKSGELIIFFFKAAEGEIYGRETSFGRGDDGRKSPVLGLRSIKA
jgi:hypothetical protein